MTNPCLIIGVLDDGAESLSPIALSKIKSADLIIGGSRTLELFQSHFKKNAAQKDLRGQLTQIPSWLEHARQKQQFTVILATGDPLCHGIGQYLLKKVGAEYCEILPNISTLQLACTRLGLAWQEAKICSIHTKDAGEWDQHSDIRHGLYPLLNACQQYERLAVFTSPENSPDRIARMLLLENMAAQFTISVAEKLLTNDECIHQELSIAQAAEMKFAEPNFVMLQRQSRPEAKTLFGLEDSSYSQRKPDKGLITKREVRAVSLARLQLRNDSIIWDIGAGSGSVGLEAAQLCPNGYVYAIEKNTADADIVKQNQTRMARHNFKLFRGKAPEFLDTWPEPDAVFIGGSGGELAELIQVIIERLKPNGCLVMNFVTLENLNKAMEALKTLNVSWDIVQLQASRSQPILHMQRMQAENPVWIVCAQTNQQPPEKNK